MAILLQALPRSTEYTIREVSFSRDLIPSLGGPVTRIDRLGTRHAIDVTIPALAASRCGPALVADLSRGRTEPVVLSIPEPTLPAIAYGAPVVNGAGQLGPSLFVRGLTPGVIVPPGKWLSVIVNGRRYAYLTTAKVTAGGTGEVVLFIFPMIRRPAPNGATIELAAPKIEGLVQGAVERSVRRIGTISLGFSVMESE